MSYKPLPINLSLTSPAAPGTLLGVEGNGGIQIGFDDYPIWTMTAKLIGVPGGTLDVILQTRDFLIGPWTDICHFPQLAIGAPAVAYRIAFARGFLTASPAVPIVVNVTDNTPVLAANQFLPWANGVDVRMVVVAGAGVSGQAQQAITGSATTEG